MVVYTGCRALLNIFPEYIGCHSDDGEYTSHIINEGGDIRAASYSSALDICIFIRMRTYDSDLLLKLSTASKYFLE